MTLTIISGGQTGVDRAALDVALVFELPCGGWCPFGRRAEDAAIADGYPLTETPLSKYRQRTEWNVRDSEGTLVLTAGIPTGGTAFTIECARRYARPCMIVDLEKEADLKGVRAWIDGNDITVLNVAGPRESTKPGVYALARAFLEGLLRP